MTFPAILRSLAQVFIRFGKLFVVVALAALLGGHWMVLQTAAWTTMLADNLRGASFEKALVKTFDGRHPCPICKAIAAGKKSEQKTKITVPMQKLECTMVNEHFAWIAPSQFSLSPPFNAGAHPLAQTPPTPPPRGFFA